MFKKRGLRKGNIRKKTFIEDENEQGNNQDTIEAKIEFENKLENSTDNSRLDTQNDEINEDLKTFAKLELESTKPTESKYINPEDLNVKSKSRIKPKVAINFEEEDESIPIFEVKKSRNSIRLTKYGTKKFKHSKEFGTYLNGTSGSSYNEDTLAQLRSEIHVSNQKILHEQETQQNEETIKSNDIIPNEDEIALAKLKREHRRQGVFDFDDEDPFLNKDFIGFDELDENETIYKSGLVREEDEIGDGEEELEHYMGARIKLRKGDMKEHLKEDEKKNIVQAIEDFANNDTYDDNEFLELELAQLNKAIGDPSLRHLLKNKIEKKIQSRKNELPKEVELPTFTSITSNIQMELNRLNEALLPYKDALSQYDKNIEHAEVQLKVVNDQVKLLKEKNQKYLQLKMKLPSLLVD